MNEITSIECELFHPGEYQIRLDCSVTNHKKILHDDIAVKFPIPDDLAILQYPKERVFAL